MEEGRHKHRILVVDDTKASLDHVTSLLVRQGYDVDGAQDGLTALKRIKNDEFDLVICDVVMPDLDGLEVLRALKRQAAPGTDFLPVMLMSVRGDVESKVMGLRLGADDYLAKPYDDAELLARVEALLRIKEMRVGHSKRRSWG